jgi:drug/metabolite transporter (DMT)-like permease
MNDRSCLTVKTKDVGILFLLSAMWGSSFLFMRISAPVLGPFLVIELRVLVAGLALLLYASLTKRKHNLLKMWKQYLIVGAINAAIPFTLIATATLTLDASVASILNSTTPLFGVFAASLCMKEKLTLKKALGIITGICGVIILLGWSPFPLTSKVVTAASLSILAALFYAFGGVYVKKVFKGVDALSMAIGQQLGAALLLLPIAITRLPSAAVPRTVILSVLTLSLLCTAVAYLLYFYLIENVGPTKTLTVTFLVPLFGVVWSVIFLGERITGGTFIGLFIILLSIFIMSDMKITCRSNNSAVMDK